MVAAWGGYVFITNLIPLYVLVTILCGRYSNRLYIAYCIFYSLGTLLAMQITFVGFNAIQSSEHFASLGIFGFLQVYVFLNWVRAFLGPRKFKQLFSLALLVSAIALVIILYLKGSINPWTGISTSHTFYIQQLFI
jgi:dolichyl-diphosphooligosaccharide--protein glycosyltransferase